VVISTVSRLTIGLCNFNISHHSHIVQMGGFHGSVRVMQKPEKI